MALNTNEKTLELNFPYFHQKSPILDLAVNAAQAHLIKLAVDQYQQGRMFGVLVAENKTGEHQYLYSYSGEDTELENAAGFVPNIIKTDQPNYQAALVQVNLLKQQIEQLTEQTNQQLKEFESKRLLIEQQLSKAKQQKQHNKKQRHQQRQQAKLQGDQQSYQQLLTELARQSVADKKVLQAVQWQCDEQIAKLEKQIATLKEPLLKLIAKQRDQIEQLNKQLYQNSIIVNAKGVQTSLYELFDGNVPDGVGKSASVNLLNHAFKRGLIPIAMTEFWWGQSPENEIRHHGQCYATSRTQTEDLFNFMLQGIPVATNPLINIAEQTKDIEIIYKDEHIVIINKPNHMLSVPGREIKDCVQSRMQTMFPEAETDMIIHRLDMATSGLMILALTKQAHRHVQQQFINRTVTKKYIAVLDRKLAQQKGEIDLPLRVDIEDRPRQCICYEYGKTAVTQWQLLDCNEKHSLVAFYPKTGRTHQIRFHAAHAKGLKSPIVGDELYGRSNQRLYLHAEQLTIKHPETNQIMTFDCPSPFCLDEIV